MIFKLFEVMQLIIDIGVAFPVSGAIPVILRRNYGHSGQFLPNFVYHMDAVLLYGHGGRLIVADF